MVMTHGTEMKKTILIVRRYVHYSIIHSSGHSWTNTHDTLNSIPVSVCVMSTVTVSPMKNSKEKKNLKTYEIHKTLSLFYI